jgi:hypothetical protein
MMFANKVTPKTPVQQITAQLYLDKQYERTSFGRNCN